MIREQWMIEVVTDQTGIVKDSGLVYKRKFALDEEIPMILRQEECLRNDSETTEKNQCEEMGITVQEETKNEDHKKKEDENLTQNILLESSHSRSGFISSENKVVESDIEQIDHIKKETSKQDTKHISLSDTEIESDKEENEDVTIPEEVPHAKKNKKKIFIKNENKDENDANPEKDSKKEKEDESKNKKRESMRKNKSAEEDSKLDVKHKGKSTRKKSKKWRNNNEEITKNDKSEEEEITKNDESEEILSDEEIDLPKEESPRDEESYECERIHKKVVITRIRYTNKQKRKREESDDSDDSDDSEYSRTFDPPLEERNVKKRKTDSPQTSKSNQKSTKNKKIGQSNWTVTRKKRVSMTTTKERTREISKQSSASQKRKISLDDEDQKPNKEQKVDSEKLKKKEEKKILKREQRMYPISKRRLNKPRFNNGVRTEINVNANSFVLVLDMKKIWTQMPNHKRLKYLSNIPFCKRLK